MKLTYQPFELELRHPFTISGFSRTSTPLMLVQLSHEGFTGHGEASMVPYMGESHQSAAWFLNKVDVKELHYPLIMPASINTWIALPPATRP
jgi:L-alanine-DL-glutamate epimerase-like enolase superfamily enzyme